MSLDFYYDEVVDKDKMRDMVRDDGKGGWVIDPNGKYQQLKPHASAAVWTMMAVAITAISDANLDEVFTRFSMYEQTRGAMRVGPDGPVYFTLAELKTLVGLRTNVSYETPAKFHANLIRVLRQEAVSKLRKEKEAAK
jgi:hypothetical protein